VRYVTLGIALFIAFSIFARQSQPQAVPTQTKALADLTNQIQEIREHVQAIEQREARADKRNQRPDLSEVKSDLSRFNDDVDKEFNKAAALAIADNKPSWAYLGGAAMSCTERLKTIMEKLTDALGRD
jgi:hypothetical protein